MTKEKSKEEYTPSDGWFKILGILIMSGIVYGSYKFGNVDTLVFLGILYAMCMAHVLREIADK